MSRTKNELIKIDALTVADLSAEYRVESIIKTEEELRFLGGVMKRSARITLIGAFEMGRRLYAMRRKILNHGEYPSWVKQNLACSPGTARNYEQLYLRFKDNPQYLLEDHTLTEAYLEAGIVRAASKPKPEEAPLQIAGEPDPGAERERMLSVFRKPTLSGVRLENHRAELISGVIYVYRKDTMAATAPVNLFFMQPPGLPETDWLEMQKSFLMATELYLEKIEAYEAQGRIEAPEDRSLPAVMGRAGKHTKE